MKSCLQAQGYKGVKWNPFRQGTGYMATFLETFREVQESSFPVDSNLGGCKMELLLASPRREPAVQTCFSQAPSKTAFLLFPTQVKSLYVLSYNGSILFDLLQPLLTTSLFRYCPLSVTVDFY